MNKLLGTLVSRLGTLHVALLGLAALSFAGPCLAGGMSDVPDVYMPPNQYIHPYHGKVVVMSLPHQAGSRLLSLSHHANGTCGIWLPKIGDPGITQALWECLAVVEVANCNGATDINTPAVRARASFGEQMAYRRPCSQGHWDWAYDEVRPSVTPTQTASAAPAVSSQF